MIIPITYEDIVALLCSHNDSNFHPSYHYLGSNYPAWTSAIACGLPIVFTLWSIHTTTGVIFLKCRFDHISLNVLSSRHLISYIIKYLTSSATSSLPHPPNHTLSLFHELWKILSHTFPHFHVVSLTWWNYHFSRLSSSSTFLVKTCPSLSQLGEPHPLL